MSRGRSRPRSVGTLSAGDVEQTIGRCMLIDRPRLQRWWRQVRRGDASPAAIARLESVLEQSATRAQTRGADRPTLGFPEQLPISARRDELADVIGRHQVVLVCGETGSGKSTQLPKICLALGRGGPGMIGHTQPRRIAARAVAARIAEEIGEPIGQRVGYKIRFRDRTGDPCRVKVMTDGILLAELQHDRRLLHYDTLIIDEAHERSLNIDFLLGYLKQLLPRRPDLKLIVTSATIDPERLSGHFDDAPVVQVSGRTWPVETRYRPLDGAGDGTDGHTQTEGVLMAADELSRESDDGDILVFLAGERDIRETADALRKHHPPGTEILSLYSRLSNTEQDRVFRPSGARRIVLATNIAETSLTVPGIRHVIDTGRARISRYSYRSKIQQLQIEPISRASAEQRQGRCGREAEGICIRLFAEQDFETRPAYTDPEILRTNLASVILRMESLNLGAIDVFPFVDPPDRRFVKDGYRLLRELEAVDGDGHVTGLGRQLSRFPVDPRLGRALLDASERACLREMLPIAAFLSIQDPRERPVDKQGAADECHKRWQVAGSDLLGMVQLWDVYLEQRRHLSVNKQRRWCREHYLAFMRMREWHDVHQQLHTQVRDAGLKINTQPAPAETVHRAFLRGFLGHIGNYHEEGTYQGPRGARFRIAPGSVLAGRTPRWIVAGNLVQTRRVYARHVAEVLPTWIEEAAGHLVRRRYDAPRWHRRRGHVVASETVSLYGLVLVSGRRVDYGRIDPAEARHIFIREALAADMLDLDAAFRDHNHAVLARVTDLEARLRRRDLVASSSALAGFFDARVPDHICTLTAFRAWAQQAGIAESGLLQMTIDDVLATDHPTFRSDDYPDSLEIDGNRYPLNYRYAPGEPDDGVTLTVAQSQLGAIRVDDLAWLIPGWLHEKIVAMIRALPKNLRRKLVPVPDVARRCMERLTPASGTLTEALATTLQREAGTPVPIDSWSNVALPDYLYINVRVIDDDGETLTEGRDLTILHEGLRITGPVRDTGSDTTSAPELHTTWSFDRLPQTVTEQDRRRRLFVGLHDEGDGVTVGRFASQDEADTAHRLGTLRLFRLACAKQERYLRRELNKRAVLLLASDPGGNVVDQLLERAARDVFALDATPPVRDAQTFATRLEDGRGRLIGRTNELAELTLGVLESWRAARRRLDDGPRGHGADAAATDMRAQLDELVRPRFLLDTPGEWLVQLPRYLRAAHMRLDRLISGDQRDPAALAAITTFQTRYDDLPAGQRAVAGTALQTYRWMLEEFRVSLFAQSLGTVVKVSPQRLERQWRAVHEASRRG